MEHTIYESRKPCNTRVGLTLAATILRPIPLLDLWSLMSCISGCCWVGAKPPDLLLMALGLRTCTNKRLLLFLLQAIYNFLEHFTSQASNKLISFTKVETVEFIINIGYYVKMISCWLRLSVITTVSVSRISIKQHFHYTLLG